jgi:hypothetical protein
MGRQQELLYNVEFNLQDMERKVARAQGHRTQDETTKFTERINELTGVLEGVNAEHRLLLDQVKQVGGAVGRWDRAGRGERGRPQAGAARNMETFLRWRHL